MKIFSNFTDAYHDLLGDVYENYDFSSAPRGQKIREKLGVSFRITNPRDRLPYIPLRDFSVAYYIAESLWYLSGDDSTAWISNYSSFWNNISDDGLTANSAYGSRIFKPHSRVASTIDSSWTQWKYVIDELTSDQDSRRAVIHIRSPQDSILATKDVPCTLSLQFFLREDKVHMVVSMRSSDLIFGIAYDIPAFTLFQEVLAKDLTARLGRPIGLGHYTHISNSLHIYEKHFKMVEGILKNDPLKSYEMSELPAGPIPIDKLLDFEAKCKSASDVERLKSLIADLNFDSNYWDDWCKILATHKANKLLNIKGESFRSFLDSTSFNGYKFFNK